MDERFRMKRFTQNKKQEAFILHGKLNISGFFIYIL
jgi:hypothetical protein